MLPPAAVRTSSFGGSIIGTVPCKGSGGGLPPSSPTLNGFSGALTNLGDTISGTTDGTTDGQQLMSGRTIFNKRARLGNTAEVDLAPESRIWDTSAEAVGHEGRSSVAGYGDDGIIDLDLDRANGRISQTEWSASSDDSPSDGQSTDLGISQAESKLRALIEACNKLEQVMIKVHIQNVDR